MKRMIMYVLVSTYSMAVLAQQDSTRNESTSVDTIRVGNFIIIKKEANGNTNVDISRQPGKARPKKNIRTNWWIVDLGYAGFNDITDYNSAGAKAFMPNAGSTPINAGDFSLGSFRVSNFNLWFFMRTHNLSRHVLNLKYGFGIESNNYFYKTNLTYVDGANPYVIRDNVDFSKNKLVASYLTVPLMLNINTAPNERRKALQISAGVSTGLLYRARQKQISDDRGKQKQSTNFNLERWKMSLVGELGLGPVKFYGSYALTPLHRYGVEQLPYNVGIRLGN